MNRTLMHWVLGMSTGLTVFAIVVPPIHLLAELVTLAGVGLGSWDNPVEVFIFTITAAVVGVFPWGMWIVLTDARKANLFDEDYEVAVYLVSAMVVFLSLIVLICTLLQHVYAEFRWFITPTVFVSAVVLVCWRWRGVWGFPAKFGIRDAIDCVLSPTLGGSPDSEQRPT